MASCASVGSVSQHFTHPGLTAFHRPALRQAGRGNDLRRHTLDFLGTPVVMTGVDHRLLLGHRRLVFFLRHPDRADARPLRNCRTTGSSLVSSNSRGPNMTRWRRNSMPMLSGTVRAMLTLCVTIISVQSI